MLANCTDIVDKIEEFFQEYDIIKTIIICPDDATVSEMTRLLYSANHSITTLYESNSELSKLTTSINSFLNHYTRVLICSLKTFEELYDYEIYDKLKEQINLLVAIHSPEEHVNIIMNSFHIYQDKYYGIWYKDNESLPQFYISS